MVSICEEHMSKFKFDKQKPTIGTEIFHFVDDSGTWVGKGGASGYQGAKGFKFDRGLE